MPGFWFLLVLAGCLQADTLPGTALGSYAVDGKLVSNTCGAQISAQKEWDFTVNLSKDEDTLYLDEVSDNDISNAAIGQVDAKDATVATLDYVVTTNVALADGSVGPCNMTLATSYDVVLNDANASKSFAGKVSFTYSAATAVSSNTDCTSQLSSSGGKFITLPCTVAYELAATRK